MTNSFSGQSIDLLWQKVKPNAEGLVPAIAQDVTVGDVLMMAWMNKESLAVSLEQGRAVYWSRSRQKLWRKGDTSGHTQELVDCKIDCDGDTLLLLVRQTGAACHTGTRTCFNESASPKGWIATDPT